MKEFRVSRFVVACLGATLLCAAVMLASGGTGGTGGVGTASSVGVSAHLAKLAAKPSAWNTFLASVGAAPQPPAPEERAQREALVHQCMAASGYEYVAIDWEHRDAAVAAARQQYRPDQATVMRTWGFGIVAGIEGTLPSVYIGDPNAEIEARMDLAGRRAYAKARVECGQAALAQVPYEHAVVLPNSIIVQIEGVHAAVAQDPRVVEAEHRWSACMALQGYDYDSEGAIIADLQRQVAPIRDAVGLLPPAPAAARAFAPEVQARLDTIRQRELALAAANLYCKVDRDVVIGGVSHEYEAEFVREHGESIAAFLTGEKG